MSRTVPATFTGRWISSPALVRGTRTLGGYVLALGGILFLNYVLLRLLPGDIQTVIGAEVMTRAPAAAPGSAGPSSLAAFGHYLLRILKGEWGVSYFFHRPVLQVIFQFLPWSLVLGFLSLAAASLLGIVLGVEAAGKADGWLDRLATGGAVVFMSLPGYLLGILLLVLFSILLPLFPLSGGVRPFTPAWSLPFFLNALRHLALPWLTLTLLMFPEYYLLTRGGMDLSLRRPFILTARGKGLRERVIRYRHAARDTLIPVLTRVGIQMGHLVTGLVFVEVVFAYPGVGTLAFESIQRRDILLMDGILLISAVWVVLMNLAADLLLRRLDPRVKEAGG